MPDIIEPVPAGEPQPENSERSAEEIKQGFTSAATRLGIMIIVIFISRFMYEVILWSMDSFLNELSPETDYLISAAFSLVFLYAIPMITTIFLMKTPVREMNAKIYKKPKYTGRALGMFPVFYGLGILTNLLTQLLGQLFRDTDVGQSFDVTKNLVVPNIVCGLILFAQLVIVAPLAEEFWFRGIVMESLRPYGNGVAIFISALLFGLTHGNFAQFFYATVLGIFFGYIAISTNSIVVTTIMHAMFNSVSAVLMLFFSQEEVQQFMLEWGKGSFPEVSSMIVIVFLVWLGLILVTAAAGIIMAIFKFMKIKKYKVPKVQEEVSAGKRWGIFFTRATVIAGFTLAAVIFSGVWTRMFG